MFTRQAWISALVLVIVALTIPNLSQGATYYISPSGSNSYDGLSSSYPWKTFSYAIPELEPGDTLIVMDGTYSVSAGTGLPSIACGTNANNGTEAQPITIQAQNERAALLESTGDDNTAFRMSGCSYWNVHGLRGKSADLATEQGGIAHSVFEISGCNHIKLQRLLATHPNRYFNSQAISVGSSSYSLVEECEAYYFHRHGISIYRSDHITVRRCYVNSRGYSDIPGGCPSHAGAEARGDEGMTFYQSIDSINENCISEGNEFFGNCGQRNQYLGSIALNNLYGFVVGHHCCEDYMEARDNTYINNIAVGSTYHGFLTQSDVNVFVDHLTSMNNGQNYYYGLYANNKYSDNRSSNPAVTWMVYPSLAVQNTLFLNNGQYGIRVNEDHVEDYAYRKFEYLNSYDHIVDNYGPGLDPSKPEDLKENLSQVDPQMGSCIVFIPETSPMKGAGKNGEEDIGANIYYRYEDGILTTQPLWNLVTGAFPCGAIVSGLNDVSGSSCIDVHERLNVNANGCTLEVQPSPANLVQFHYRWRNDNGGETDATFMANQDTAITGLEKSTTVRQRFEVSNEGLDPSDGVAYQLQVAQTSTCSTGTYSAVPTDTSGHWKIVGSDNITDGDATTNVASGLTDEATTFVAGQIKDAGNTTASITLAGDRFTEIEFAIQATTNALAGAHYCFRLYNNTTPPGAPLNTNSKYAEVTLAGSSAKAIYYSVGTDSSAALHTTTASASSGVLTLDDPAPAKIGVGDEIREGTNRYYITGRSSSTSFNIQTATGSTNISFGPSASITIWRAFGSLTLAESGSRDGNHLGNGNIRDGNYQLNLACYADDVMVDSVQFSGGTWTTSPDNYIRIYTPTSPSEVGTSQRHNGTWGTGFRIHSNVTANHIFRVGVNYIRLEGIALQAATNYAGLHISSSYGSFSANNDVRISHCLIIGQGAGGSTRGVYVYDSVPNLKVTIWNTIAYNNTGWQGFYFQNVNTAYCYNCTSYGNTYGFYTTASAGSVVLMNCLAVGNTSSDYYYSTSWGASSDYNMSGTANTSDSRQAPGPDIDSGTTATGTTTTVVKLDDTSMISAGDWFNNTTREKSSRIASVDDNTTLTLSEAIASQTTGDSYNVKHSAWYRSATNNFISTTDLHLKSTADAINAGTSLSSIFTDDIDGVTRAGAWDMGADEFGSFIYRRPITIPDSMTPSSCTSNVEDFPLPVKFTDATLKSVSSGGHVYSTQGYDIVFRAEDGETQLDHEIEKYVPSTGELVAWVRIPQLSYNADTTIYMYYGNPEISAPTANPTGVWKSGYVGVWHLSETSDTHYDSTGNGNHSISQSVTTQGSATGKLGGADDFNGSSNNIVVGDSNSLDITDAITIEAWINPDTLTGRHRFVTKDAASAESYVLRAKDGVNLEGYLNDNGTVRFAIKNSILTTSGYQHVAVTWTKSGDGYLTLFYNGSEVSGYTRRDSMMSSITTSGDPLYIGSNDQPAECFDGPIDEVRISNVARDACWIGTSYASMETPASVGAEGEAGPTGIELNSFTAMGQGDTVLVQWETKTEVENLGFNLYRSTERDGTYTKLNSSLISGLMSSVRGRGYSFTDGNLTKGKLYYYKLEDIDLKGKRTVHGPVCVDWDRDGIPDDVDPDVRDSDPAPGGGSGGGDISGGGFWVYGDSTVTRVMLQKFRAHETQDGVLVEWQTGYEVNNLGFHLYREVDGEVLRLTPELVAGSALLAGSGISLRAGHQYRWWDISAIADVQGSLTLKERPSASRTVPQVAGLEANNSSTSSEAHEPNMVQGEALLKRSAPQAKRSVLYWLEDVDLSGKRTMHGPARVEPGAPGSQLGTSKHERPRFLSEFGKRLDERYEEFWKIQELKEKLALKRLEDKGPLRSRSTSFEVKASNLEAEGRSSNLKLLKGAPQGNLVPDRQADAVQRYLSGHPAVKLFVKEAGWYRVSRSELEGAGLSSRVDPQSLRLYTEGVEVPLGVVSEKHGRSVLLEAIEFYGLGVDTPSTDTRVYWLVERPGRGQRVEVSQPRGGFPGSPSFPYTVEKKDRVFYFASLKNGDESNFFGPIISRVPVDQRLEVRHPDLSASAGATLELRVQGVTALPHEVGVFINEIGVGTLSWEGQTLKTGFFSVPQSDLMEGENLVTLVPLGGETDVSLVESIRLTYWHTYRAYEDELRCKAQGGTQVSIDGFSSPEVRVFDITDSGGVFEIETKRNGKGKSGGTGYGVTFSVSGSGARSLLALTDGRIKTPVEIRANQPSSWHRSGGYDFVMVAHGDFMESLESLEALRKSEGLSVGVVDIEDVYDEFNFGIRSPQALKDFLSHARSSWSRQPRFVLLVGDASFDPRNYLGYGDQDYVPTKLIDTVHLETASDDWFVDFNNDGLPEMAIGRLPVQTAEEAATVVSKMIGYEKSGEKKEALLVADRAEGADDFDFEGASEEVRALLPAPILVRKIFRGQFSSDAQAKAELLGGINQGPLLVNFMGHGSLEVWRGGLLTMDDAESLVNGLQLPFFVSMTCLNGFFQAPYGDSLAEVLLKAKGGGGVAVWTSSGLTEPDKQTVMNKELIKLLFGKQGLTLGEATARAKASVSDQDVRKTWILFGDPTTRLKP